MNIHDLLELTTTAKEFQDGIRSYLEELRDDYNKPFTTELISRKTSTQHPSELLTNHDKPYSSIDLALFVYYYATKYLKYHHEDNRQTAYILYAELQHDKKSPIPTSNAYCVPVLEFFDNEYKIESFSVGRYGYRSSIISNAYNYHAPIFDAVLREFITQEGINRHPNVSINLHVFKPSETWCEVPCTYQIFRQNARRSNLIYTRKVKEIIRCN